MAKPYFEDSNENFEELLEQSFTGVKSYTPGEAVQAEIISISTDTIFLQLNGKSEGVLDKSELLDSEGVLTVAEGETIKAFFLNSKNGELQFTTKISGDKAGKAVLQEAFKSGIPVEGFVDKEIKGGFQVKIGDSRAFCPYSQMGSKRVEEASEYIGKHLTFKISEYSEGGRNILVSNRAYLELEKEKLVGELKKNLNEGMEVLGTVISLRDFGAFVDVQGLQALLPISEIQRSRVDNIHKVLAEGQEIKAKLIKLDWQNEKITLSMKALLRDPWTDVKSSYKTGNVYSGKVSRIAPFGAFVTLEEGLDGLLHISEIQGDSRDNNPESHVKKGQSINVRINSIDAANKRISLKLVSSLEEEENYSQYMEEESETYNPFAQFMKKGSSKK